MITIFLGGGEAGHFGGGGSFYPSNTLDRTLTWYSEEAQKQINPGNGGGNGEVNVDLRLTALKQGGE